MLSEKPRQDQTNAESERGLRDIEPQEKCADVSHRFCHLSLKVIASASAAVGAVAILGLMALGSFFEAVVSSLARLSGVLGSVTAVFMRLSRIAVVI